MAPTWYVKNTGSGQSLIIEEGSGKNIAVAYDPENGPILAAAPVLLEACMAALAELEDPNRGPSGSVLIRGMLWDAIAEAKGG